MNRRLVPSPACVIATGRRGLRLGKARTVLIGSGEVSTLSAAKTEAQTRSAAAATDCEMNCMAGPGEEDRNRGTDIIAGGGPARHRGRGSSDTEAGEEHLEQGPI